MHGIMKMAAWRLIKRSRAGGQRKCALQLYGVWREK